jgi:Kdo2-lipid IVA lauroyltransferase/acyltransferase
MRQMVYEGLASLGQAASFAQMRYIGELLGKTIWKCVPSRGEVATQAIQDRLGVDRTRAAIIAQNSFIQNGRSFLEILCARKVDWRFIQKRVHIENHRQLGEILQANRKRPCIIVAAHLGAWELLGGLLHLLDKHDHKQVVVKATHDAALQKVIKRLRSHSSVHILEHEQAAAKVIRNLRNNGLCAFLVDHNCRREEAVFLPFMGEMAAVNIGPAMVALRGKAMVWPVFLVRDQSGEQYRLHHESPLDVNQLQGDRQEKIRAIATFYTQAVERHVRMYPEQWFWMHRRWKTRPADE